MIVVESFDLLARGGVEPKLTFFEEQQKVPPRDIVIFT